MSGKSGGKVRFYDSLKARIIEWLRPKLGGRLVKLAEFTFLLPDIMILLGRLLLDKRVPRRLRIKLGMILGYLASPLDLVPEAVVGPLGLVEDLVLVAFALNRVFAEVEDEILSEHWSGRPEHLEKLGEMADLVDGVFSGKVGGKLQDWYDLEAEIEVEGEETPVELVSEEAESEEERVERLRASGL
jgi:uncharacterized membrane protein YkvA (DUF1232 family)